MKAILRSIVDYFTHEHDWTEWHLMITNEGCYDEEMWWERECRNCGRVEQQEQEDRGT